MILHAGKNARGILFLRSLEEGYGWFQEERLVCEGETIPQAINNARRKWSEFRSLHCGFRYTLPTRDLAGSNALFHQMAASYAQPKGVYFDDEIGGLCYVNFASQEALELWRKMR